MRIPCETRVKIGFLCLGLFLGFAMGFGAGFYNGFHRLYRGL